MSSSKNPMVGDENAGTIKHLLGPAKQCCEEWPVPRTRLSSPDNSGSYFLLRQLMASATNLNKTPSNIPFTML